MRRNLASVEENRLSWLSGGPALTLFVVRLPWKKETGLHFFDTPSMLVQPRG